jgi:predicted nucleic acid-binding Zn ribbon protein
MSPDSDDELEWVCKDIASRQRYRRAPRAIAEVVSGLMAKRGYATVLAASEWEEAWQAAAGPQLGRASRSAQLRRGVLEIVVRNSAVVQELTFRKKDLLRQLAERLGSQKIRDLRFRVGALD